MNLSKRIDQIIENNHLLMHPFYQAWMAGTLSFEKIQNYACQYYWHVESFPRYLSTIHSKTLDIQNRRVLLENLVDEEGLNHKTDHPELWMRFVEGLGVNRNDLQSTIKSKSINSVIQTFFNAAKEYSTGIAALYVYESQVPEIAESKIKGLINNYNIKDKTTLSFFEVHRATDKFHRKAIAKLIDRLSYKEKDKAMAAAEAASKSLLGFLTEMNSDEKNVA